MAAPPPPPPPTPPPLAGHYPAWDAGIKEGGFAYPMSTDVVWGIAAVGNAVFGPAMVAFQDLCMHVAPEQVVAVKAFIIANSDPVGRTLLPMQDPIDVLFCCLMYFVGLVFFFVVSKIIGKRELRYYGIFHNLFLAALSLWMALSFFFDARSMYSSVWNIPIKHTGASTAFLYTLWVFTMSKLVEYGDTYIMVLKQNYRQISFLHLFHHSSIFLVCYVWTYLAPGGDAYWSPMVNSGIHVVMYLYYFLNLVFRTGPIRRFLQANKFLITYGQITQFAFNVVQTVYILFIASESRFPRFPLWINLVYMIMLISLFLNFLLRNKDSKGKGAKGGAAIKPKHFKKD